VFEYKDNFRFPDAFSTTRTILLFVRHKASERCGPLGFLQSDERPELRDRCSTSILPVECGVFRKEGFLTRQKRDNEIRHKDFRNEESNVYELENRKYEEAWTR